MKPQEVSSVMWALAALGRAPLDRVLINALLDAVERTAGAAVGRCMLTL
jgi:hypothetical protein